MAYPNTYFRHWASDISIPLHRLCHTNHLDQSHHSCNRRCQTSGKATWKAYGLLEKIGTSQQDTWEPPIPPTNCKVTTIPQEIDIWGMGTWRSSGLAFMACKQNHLILSPEEMHAISNRSLSITYVHNHQYHGECNDPKWHWRPFKNPCVFFAETNHHVERDIMYNNIILYINTYIYAFLCIIFYSLSVFPVEHFHWQLSP